MFEEEIYEMEPDDYRTNEDNDEYLDRKYGYNYRYLKSIYPAVCDLPKGEVYPMIKLFYEKGDTLEEAEKYLKEYIQDREPYWFRTWLSDYSDEYEQPYSVEYIH